MPKKINAVCFAIAIVTISVYTIHENHWTKRLSTSDVTSLQPRYRERVTRIREQCRLHGSEYNEDWISLQRYTNLAIDDRPRLYISDKYKVMVCNVPKCGSTQWRKLLTYLENDSRKLTVTEYRNKFRDRLLWHSEKGLDAAERKVNEYYRIMTVREPLERLVSAYKDKLVKVKQPVFVAMTKRIRSKNGNNTDGELTFSEFVDSILAAPDLNRVNKHWKPFTANCDPCLFDYDIIAKLETIDEDFPYIASKLKIKALGAFSKDSDSLKKKWKSNYRDYYKTLTPHQRLKIFELYKSQYDYFGYPYPDYL